MCFVTQTGDGVGVTEAYYTLSCILKVGVYFLTFTSVLV